MKLKIETPRIKAKLLPYSGLLLGILAVVVLFANGVSHGQENGNDLRILKSEVTATAKFYPYNADGTKLEVIAVKASDGSIRTAFNTCQVCFDSGRGFYTQQGNELTCNNCGNRFKIDQLEKVRFGCNPIPIMKENKTDDGKYITIAKEFLVKNKAYFARWKKN